MKILGLVKKEAIILFVEEHSEEADGIFYRIYLDDILVQSGSVDGSSVDGDRRHINELMREIYQKEILKR